MIVSLGERPRCCFDGVDNAFEAADALRDLGVGAALVKLADGGVVLFSSRL